MTFSEIARRRGLTAAKLDALTWDVEPCPYQRLQVPSHPPLDPLLTLMKRRALDPALLPSLFDVFPDRPIERALLAYDVVNAALLGADDDALLARVTQELAPIKPFAQTTAAVTRDHVQHLIAAARPSPDAPTSLLDDLIGETPSLAALLMINEVRTDFVDSPELLHGILAHAKRLELAHLPSLALAFLQILWARFASVDALDLLIEIALDHDMIHAIPQLTGTDARALQQQTYVLVRAACANFNVVDAQRILDAVPSEVRQAPHAPLILARAHVILLQEKRLDDDAVALVKKIVPTGVPWRFAHLVEHALDMQRAPDSVGMYLDGFITRFGNDPYLWAHAADHKEARPQLLALLAREIRYGSHDPHVWRAASILVDEGHALNDELDRRMDTQLLTALRGDGGPPS